MLVTNSDQKTRISLKFYTSLLIIKVIKEESFGKLDFQIVICSYVTAYHAQF